MAFDAANLDKARDIIARYPHKKSAVLPLLHLAQDQEGWVTPVSSAISFMASALSQPCWSWARCASGRIADFGRG